MALMEYTGQTDFISELDDLPNDVGGLTAAQLKAMFDLFGTEFVAWLNNVHLNDVITHMPNRNLLHNWDFRNPVNQRGLATYTTGYAVDRWSMLSAGSFIVGSGFISLSPGLFVIQRLEIGRLRAGIHTFTIFGDANKTFGLTMGHYGGSDSSWVYVTTDANGYASFNYTFLNDITHNPFVYILNQGASVQNVYAVKLEKGSASTLAIDPPADFAEQLALCMRFYEKSYSYAVVPGTALSNVGIVSSPLPNVTTVGHLGMVSAVRYAAAKRTAPTVTIYPYTTPTNTGRVSDANGTDLAANSGAVYYASEKGFAVVNASGSAINPGGAILFHYVASADL